MNQLATISHDRNLVTTGGDSETLVTLYIGDQIFGLPVLRVRDILNAEAINQIPLAPKEVAGSINLRGRIVTVIDMRTRLGLPPRQRSDHNNDRLCVTVDHKNELYGMLIDRIGDVLELDAGLREDTPSTLNPLWRGYSEGIYRLDKALLVILDIESFLGF